MKELEPLTVTHPELATEWSDRNFPFTAEDEHYQSYSKVWWRCKHGHEWYASVIQRATRKTGCPYCAGKRIIPGFNDFASAHPECVKEWSERNLPLLPTQFAPHSNRRIIWKCECGHEWETAICNRARGNGCPICAKQPVIPSVNDLATTHPEIAAEWSEKNLPLTPSQIRASYRKQVIWKCSACGYEYTCQPFTITHSKKKCPNCVYELRRRNPIERTKREHILEYTDGISKRRTTLIRDEEVAVELKEGLMYYGQDNYIRHSSNVGAVEEKPVWDKFTLTVEEASKYFAISIVKLRALIAKDRAATFLAYEGGYVRIIRRAFEDYLDKTNELEV